MKDDMFVFGMIAGIVREIARYIRCRFLRHIVGSLDNHPPGHSKMREQDRAVVEFSDKIFCPPTQLFKRTALKTLTKIVRHRNSEVVTPHLYPLDPAAFHNLGKAAANGFNFGEFGHIEKVAGSASARYPQTHELFDKSASKSAG